MEIHECPPLDEALIRWLEQTFPDRLPKDPQVTLCEVHMGMGAQKVIARLRVEFERQHDPTEETE